mgnify:CR=1 FL=1
MYKDFYEAFWYINSLIFFGTPLEIKEFKDNLELVSPDWMRDSVVHVVKVNPLTSSIDDDDQKNTKVRFWLEVGHRISFERFQKQGSSLWHDFMWDSEGDSFEEAVINLANIIEESIAKVKQGDKNWVEFFKERFDPIVLEYHGINL